jgi:hypothetical protein
MNVVVLFKNNPHRNRPAPLDAEAVERLCWWNLWQRPQPPFESFGVGDPIILVDSWSTGSRLGWQVEVTSVEHARYGLKAEAVDMIATSMEIPVARVLADPYTDAKPDGAGVLIAWRARAVHDLDRPRPPGLLFRQNGWLSVDDPDLLHRWGLFVDDNVDTQPDPS